jgi:UDP-N-acetylglucosamine diphosphorylase / glucose-1-phosphate thymidylyltransferase / UDP-N-acetylgalactosamine diphosphorylase / glucosamine-1-phosphate N-acetyltransferase / galactosamine-1-phosphate N-acetyltransferase
MYGVRLVRVNKYQLVVVFKLRLLLFCCIFLSIMQCVILAAGKGTRLRPITDNLPKPLVKVAGKTLLDHIVGALPSSIDEVIFVTGYLEDQIRAYCGVEFHGRKVTYVTQTEQKGTAHALWLCKDLLKGRFLFMFADDLHGPSDIARVASYTRAMLTYTTNTPEKFGIVVRHPDGTLAEMIEKPEHPPSNLASTGVMVLDDNIFKYNPYAKETKGEYYLTDVIAEYAKEYPIAVVEQSLWIPIGYPEDIEKAEKILAARGSLNKEYSF